MSNYAKAQAILNRAAMQAIAKQIAYNVVMVKSNGERSVICSHTGRDAEKIAHAQAGRCQWEAEERFSTAKFIVEAK
jgi:hypothetical protein